MTSIDDYALKLLHQGAESCAEDDMDENGELNDPDTELPAAIERAIGMAHAIRDNPLSFRTWVNSVTA